MRRLRRLAPSTFLGAASGSGIPQPASSVASGRATSRVRGNDMAGSVACVRGDVRRSCRYLTGAGGTDRIDSPGARARMDETASDVTVLLRRWSEGDASALDA